MARRSIEAVWFRLFAVVLAGTCVAAWGARGDEPGQGDSVRFEDLQSGKVRIIGTLGVPLGEVVEVSGYWRFPPEGTKLPKPGLGPTFLIETINGRRVKNPLAFDRGDVWILRGAGFEVANDGEARHSLVVFETCYQVGVPPGAWEHIKIPVATLALGLHSRLNVIRAAQAEDGSTQHANDGQADFGR